MPKDKGYYPVKPKRKKGSKKSKGFKHADLSKGYRTR